MQNSPALSHHEASVISSQQFFRVCPSSLMLHIRNDGYSDPHRALSSLYNSAGSGSLREAPQASIVPSCPVARWRTEEIPVPECCRKMVSYTQVAKWECRHGTGIVDFASTRRIWCLFFESERQKP